MTHRITVRTSRMNQPRHHLQRDAFTLLELLIVLAIIGILIGLLSAAVSLVRNQARQTLCLADLRQVSFAGFGYSDDNRGQLPYIAITYYKGGVQETDRWSELIAPYVESARVGYNQDTGSVDLTKRTLLAGCPEWQATQAWKLGYGMNPYLDTPDRPKANNRVVTVPGVTGLGTPVVTFRRSALSYPSARMLFADADGYNALGTPPFARHHGRINTAFCDGHLAIIADAAAFTLATSHPENSP